MSPSAEVHQPYIQLQHYGALRSYPLSLPAESRSSESITCFNSSPPSSREPSDDLTPGDSPHRFSSDRYPPPPLLSSIQTVRFGSEDSLRSRHVYVDTCDQVLVSPWNYIPLFATDQLLHVICTTSAGTWVRRQLAHDEPHHPLRIFRLESTDSGPPHYKENAPWNIGLLPQTSAASWQTGRSAPLEVVDIRACARRAPGEAYMVKPLGAFIAVEGPQESVSWKIIAIAVDDPMAESLHDVADLQQHLPGNLEVIREWLRHSHVYDQSGEASWTSAYGRARKLLPHHFLSPGISPSPWSVLTFSDMDLHCIGIDHIYQLTWTSNHFVLSKRQ